MADLPQVQQWNGETEHLIEDNLLNSLNLEFGLYVPQGGPVTLPASIPESTVNHPASVPSRPASPSQPRSMAIQEQQSQMALKVAQTQEENAQLKAELAGIYNNRQTEQVLCNKFVNAIRILDTSVPDRLKTRNLKAALNEIEVTCNAYRNFSTAMNRSTLAPQGVLPPVPANFNAGVLIDMVRTDAGGLMQDIRPTESLHNNERSASMHDELRRATNLIRGILAKLRARRSAETKSLVDALATLENQLQSFGHFIALYLNGRSGTMETKIRFDLHKIIDQFFADNDDANLVVNELVKVVQGHSKLSVEEVEGIQRDIVGPVGAAMWAMLDICESLGE